VEVVLDGAGADEELAGDLRVRQAVSCEPCDLSLSGVSSSRVSTRRLRAVSPVAASYLDALAEGASNA